MRASFSHKGIPDFDLFLAAIGGAATTSRRREIAACAPLWRISTTGLMPAPTSPTLHGCSLPPRPENALTHNSPHQIE